MKSSAGAAGEAQARKGVSRWRIPRRALAALCSGAMLAQLARPAASAWLDHVILDDSTTVARDSTGWFLVDWGYERTRPREMGDTLQFFAPVDHAPAFWGLWRWDVTACETADSAGAGTREEPTLVRTWFVGAPGRTRFVYVINDFPPGPPGAYELAPVDSFRPRPEECR